jgi:hypothetical protein
MSSFGRVRISAVWAMLDHCAKGYKKKQTTHYWCVMYGSKTYPTFPLGEHGTRSDPEIQIGKVKNLVRYFGVLDCAKSQLEALK